MLKAKKILTVLFNIITYFLIFLLSFYIIFICYQKFSGKSDVVSLGKICVFKIASSSMETNYYIDDYVIVLKTDNYEVGDVITFKENNSYITHRVVDINGDVITTKGDANDTNDDSIDKSEVLGKVVGKSLILTFVMKYRIALIGIICFIFLADLFLKKEELEEV